MSQKLNVEERIDGYERLTSIFGYWPTFHDSEVLWIRLDREQLSDRCGPTLDALIHLFEMTSEVDAKGFCVRRHHTLAHFRFHNVVELHLREFNCQNVLWALEISDIQERQMERIHFEVVFASSFGVSASFHCHRIALVGVTPCSDDAKPLTDALSE